MFWEACFQIDRVLQFVYGGFDIVLCLRDFMSGIRFYIFFAVLVLFFGCQGSGEISEGVSSEAEGESVSTRSQESKFFFEGEASEHTGLTAVIGKRRVSISSGRPELLETTNASRGFGFRRITGRALDSDFVDGFIYRDSGLNSDMLQISRVDGVAILDRESWYGVAKDEHVAWLPLQSVPVMIHAGEDPSYRYIRSRDRLGPGFYVFHDESFMQGRVRSDVRRYYPFVVGNDYPGMKSEQCFTEIFQNSQLLKYDFVVDFIYRELLRACVVMQQLELKSQDVKGSRSNELAERLLVLDVLRFGVRSKNWNAMMKSRNAEGNDVQQWIWWQAERGAYESYVRMLSGSGDVLSPSELYALYGERLRREFELSTEAIYRIVFRLLGDHRETEKIFGIMSEGGRADNSVLRLAAAYHLWRMEGFTKEHRRFLYLYESMSSEVPSEISGLRDVFNEGSLETVTGLQVGPLYFGSPLPDAEVRGAVRKWVKNRSGALEYCLRVSERRRVHDSGLYILEIPGMVFVRDGETSIHIRDMFDGDAVREFASSRCGP